MPLHSVLYNSVIENLKPYKTNFYLIETNTKTGFSFFNSVLALLKIRQKVFASTQNSQVRNKGFRLMFCLLTSRKPLHECSSVSSQIFCYPITQRYHCRSSGLGHPTAFGSSGLTVVWDCTPQLPYAKDIISRGQTNCKKMYV